MLKQCYFSYNARTCSPIETKAVVTLYCIALAQTRNAIKATFTRERMAFTPARKPYRVGQT